jgi:hypothetical protein
MFKRYSGADYLMINAAEFYGIKGTFEERINWCKTNLNNLESLVPTSKKPPLFLKTVYAIRDTQAGIPIGHLVELDACSSGIQLMSVVMGCKIGAMNTGLVNPDVMPDAYTTCTEHMISELGYSIEVKRDDAKKALMVYFYGSEAKPKEIFGEGTAEYNAFFKAAQKTAPEAYDLRSILIGAWQPFTLEHSWVMPDGFDVRIKVMQKKNVVVKVPELNSSFTHIFNVNEGTEKGLSLSANAIHATDSLVVREMNRRCNYDIDAVIKASDLLAYELAQRTPATITQACKTRFISLNQIDNLTKESVKQLSIVTLTRLYELTLKVLKESKPFELVCIHDAFKCLAGNMNSVRYWYKEILAELADSHIMQDILCQIYNNPKLTLDRASEDLGDLIRNSNYGIA